MSTAATIDLTQFCDGCTSLRYAIDKPFVKNRWRCATDGAIAVMTPADGEPDTHTEARKVPDVPSLILSMHEGNREWKPWPESVDITNSLQECRRCKGSGALHTKDCPECDGAGESKCGECGQTVDCDNCDGEGVVHCGKCPDCDGKKKMIQPWSCKIGGKSIRQSYASKVRALPGVTYAVNGEAILFRAEGGLLGVVMCVLEE